LINGTPNADPAPPELTSGGGVMDWLSGMFGGERALPTLPAEPARPVQQEARSATGLINTIPVDAPTTRQVASDPVSRYVDPYSGQMTAEGRERLDNPALGFDTGGIGAAGILKGYHGSPHAFDRFSNEAIGTGEAPGPVSILKDGTILSGEMPVGRVKYDHGDASTRIGDIAINPSMQNQGIGSQVIRQIQDEAAARGNPVVLSTDAFRGPQAQADQLRLYQRLGFEPNTGPGQVSERIGGRKIAEDLVWQPPGFTAYHGSPHEFPPTARNPLGEFDPVKIGTGEGSQAFGVGAGYLGEAENTAKYYRDRYGPQADPKVQAAGDEYNNAHAAFDGSVAARARVEAAERALQDAEANAPPGHMYEVKVHADPARFLDWDRPLSRQHPDVQAALAKINPDMYHPSSGDYDPSESGQMIYHRLASRSSQADASAALNAAGVPGIRYLDAGSRGAGEGSRNLVVFDPARMDIIRRYGLAGLMAGAGAAATQGRDQTQ
jgi:GNAT superfamily N-acetyltransferase